MQLVDESGPDESLDLAIIGAGPTASSLLERLTANAPELLTGRPLRVHLIDPHRAGTGRVWRPDLHPLLWMNSMAEDVTMFTDDSVRCEGPLRPGPSLHEWAHSVDDDTLAALCSPELVAEIRGLSGMTFPTRLVQSVYLDWFHREVVASLPDGVEVVVHERRAIDVRDGDDGCQWVTLEGVADALRVDVVVFALGHLDAVPGPGGDALSRFASANGLSYLPAGHTAEHDLSLLHPGEDVIVLGFGQAFTDLVILLTEARGGRFVDGVDGALRYEASGREPIVHVGSRRGVPYRSKLDYRLQAAPAPLPRFLDEATVERLIRGDQPLEFRRDVMPIVLKEVGWAYYHELFNAHPQRTSMAWDDFAERFAASSDPREIDRLVAASVPDPRDHFDVGALNQPLAGLEFASADDAHRHIARCVVDDVARRTDPTHSADLGAFNGLLTSFATIGRIAASGRLTPRSRIEEVGWWFSFFMYFASGPPPTRLRQFLALADAGVLRFIGAGIDVTADPTIQRFVAGSTSHPDRIVGTAFVDARIAAPSVSRTTDVLLRRLHERGEVVEEVVADAEDWSANSGKVMVTGDDLRIVVRDGSAHPRRHGIGVFTSRPAAGTFARPRTNAASFRQNDTIARSILRTLADIHAALAVPSESVAS